MSIGMYSYTENTRKLRRIEEKLKDPKTPQNERNELEEWKKELQSWFSAFEEAN